MWSGAGHVCVGRPNRGDVTVRPSRPGEGLGSCTSWAMLGDASSVSSVSWGARGPARAEEDVTEWSWHP